ncbi:MAG: RIP metalloprotease RseP [Bacillota bacterium]
MVLTIFTFVVVLGVLIFIHEFGHYITAKKSDILVEEFALGFGPKLISKKVGETVYSIRSIPLGGFCNMAGEFPADDEDMEEKEREIYKKAEKNGRLFHQKSAFKRFAVIFMGPVMNFLLAALIFILIFSVFGIPVSTSNEAVLGEIIPEKPASEAGLQPNDRIISIDGTPVESWEEMASLIRENPSEVLKIEFKRGEEIQKVTLIPEYSKESDGGIIGIYPQLIRENISFFESFKLGVLQTFRVIQFTIMGFVQMISERSASDVGGPIMIASIVGQAAKVGILNVLNWTAIISINLGIINLLPFPALDGGRILFIVIEMIRGKAFDAKKENFVHLIGFVILIMLMVFIIYKDIMRSLF